MNIFRAYDIRGIYGVDLNEDIMEKIGRAAGTYYPGNFTIGRDFREHSEQLETAFISGLRKTGSNAFLVGNCPASVCVFANMMLKNDVASYITASHLSSEWNGVKFVHQDGVGFFEDENMILEEIYNSDNFKEGIGISKTVHGVEDQYIKHISDRIHPEEIKVVVDFGNGASCFIVPKILKELGVESRFLFDWPDPKFSNRDPEPSPESLTALCNKVVEEKADLGIAFDGDGDRAMYVDNEGKVMMTEQSSILFIRDLMNERRGSVVANIECSSLIEDEVKKYGEKVYRIPVGHSFLVQETKKNNAILGIEKSGHICIPKFFWFDDAIMNSMYMIEIVSKMDSQVSEILKDLPPIFFESIKTKCSDNKKFLVMDKIRTIVEENYKSVNTIDGVRIDFPNSWALIRASNTSPILRLSIEAKEQKRLNELKKEMMEIIEGVLNKPDEV